VSEKLNHLCVALGKERIEIAELHAGDIGAVAKLRDTHTNDTLSTKDRGLVLPKIPFPEPVITVRGSETARRGRQAVDRAPQAARRGSTFHHEYNGELARR